MLFLFDKIPFYNPVGKPPDPPRQAWLAHHTGPFSKAPSASLLASSTTNEAALRSVQSHPPPAVAGCERCSALRMQTDSRHQPHAENPAGPVLSEISCNVSSENSCKPKGKQAKVADLVATRDVENR